MADQNNEVAPVGEAVRETMQRVFFPDGRASVSALQRTSRLSWNAARDFLEALNADGWLDGLEKSPHIATQAAPVATSDPDEPTEREQLIACLGDDAAKLIAQNPDDEMAQTMRDAAAMLEATSEQMGGAQVAKAVAEFELRKWGKEEWEVAWFGEVSKLMDGLYYKNYKVGDKVKLYAPTTERAVEEQATERKPLTDAQIWQIVPRHNTAAGELDPITFTRAIERHHGIGSDK